MKICECGIPPVLAQINYSDGSIKVREFFCGEAGRMFTEFGSCSDDTDATIEEYLKCSE